MTISQNLNLLRGKRIRVSVYVEVENAQSGRIGAEPGFKIRSSNRYFSAWLNAEDYKGKNFKGVISKEYTIPDEPINEIVQSGIYNQIKADKSKVGNFKIEVLDEVSPTFNDLIERLKYIDKKLDALGFVKTNEGAVTINKVIDFNDMTTNGDYLIGSSAYAGNNAPPNIWGGLLRVSGTDDFVFQEYIQHEPVRYLVRRKMGTKWNKWTEFQVKG